MKQRYSYSYISASKFIPIYDKLIEAAKNPLCKTPPKIIISTIHFAGSSSATIQNRLTDGLKWISDNFDKIGPEDVVKPRFTQDDYKFLKASWKTSVCSDIHGNPAVRAYVNVLSTESIQLEDTGIITTTVDKKAVGFRADLTAWITDKSATQAKMFKDLKLSDADRVWLDAILGSSPALIHFMDVNGNLTVVKSEG